MDVILLFDQYILDKTSSSLLNTIEIKLLIIRFLFLLSDWLQAVRAFESIAVITSTVSTFLIAFYFIFPKRGQGRKVCLISIIACLLTGEKQHLQDFHFFPKVFK